MDDDLLERVAATGLLARGAAGRRAALRRPRLGLPARLRRALAGADASARCTSTTACATRPAATRATAARCARGSASTLDVEHAAPARRRAGQPAGVGARRPLRAPAARAAPRRRAASPPATPPPTRPRRSSTGSPPRPAAARCSGMARARRAARAPAARASRARRPRRSAARAAWRGARTPRTTSDRYARGRVRAGLVPALRRVHPAAERNVVRTAELLRDEAEVLDDVVDTALGRPRPDRRRRTSPRCRARSRGSWCAAWPRTPSAGSAPARPARLDDILALRRRRARPRRRRAGRRRATACCGWCRPRPPTNVDA